MEIGDLKKTINSQKIDFSEIDENILLEELNNTLKFLNSIEDVEQANINPQFTSIKHTNLRENVEKQIK